MSTPKGARGTLNIFIKNLEQVQAESKDIQKKAEKAVKRTVSDFKSRAPAWISAAVVEEYGIKKSDVKDAISGKKKAGSINVGGIVVDNVAIEYRGRPLTPTHFKMRPTKPPARRVKDFRRVPGSGVGEGSKVAMVKPPAPYKITAEIKKGKRVQLSADAFLGSNKGAGNIPFQRTGTGRTPIKSIKTVSVPQMVTNEKVAEKITENINENLGKRLQYHLERELKK
ncbi:MAG: hypothetical protein IJ680_01265 [Paludibacteraceae bacterium]|nr:hypothetical protein [Eubacterium sp.]MBR1630463.1 hypothetical protein [Paludibacteraceae bacterium]